VKPFEFEQYGRGREKKEVVRQAAKEYSVSHYLTDGAIASLGVILGERYEINLNSHSVIALSS
jgi:hypothetical protein